MNTAANIAVDNHVFQSISGLFLLCACSGDDRFSGPNETFKSIGFRGVVKLGARNCEEWFWSAGVSEKRNGWEFGFLKLGAESFVRESRIP